MFFFYNHLTFNTDEAPSSVSIIFVITSIIILLRTSNCWSEVQGE